MFRAHVFIIRRSKLYYKASGIITLIGVHETANYMCDDTKGCVMQFWPPDDDHMCSKHVEAWNKLIVKQKFCASIWLITEINVLRCTVSKTSKFTKIKFSSFYCGSNRILSKTIQTLLNNSANIVIRCCASAVVWNILHIRFSGNKFQNFKTILTLQTPN